MIQAQMIPAKRGRIRRKIFSALSAALLPAMVTHWLLSWASTETTASQAAFFYQVAISPDGNQVAWVQPALGAEGQMLGGSAIYVEGLDAAQSQTPRRISAMSGATNAGEDNIAWSPDSKQLAFLSDAASPGQPQIYVTGVEAGTARRLTNLTGYLSDPAWSPDGKMLAFLFTENAPRVAGPLMPMTPETGVIESRIYEQRLAVVNVTNGKARQLSPSDMYVYEFDWSPDSKSFALTAAHGEGDSNWYVAELYRMSVSRAEMLPIYKPRLQIAVPRWSPDGDNIAFIGGLMSDEGVTGGDIFVLSANGGDARDVTPGIEASPSWLQWVSTTRIEFAETVDGETGIEALALPDGKSSSIWQGPESITTELNGNFELSLAREGRSAMIRHSALHPPEIWAGAIGAWKQITHINDAVKPGWGEMKSVHWMSDGMRIEGWLMFPRDYDPVRRYPMVVVAHGGPAAASHPSWPGTFFNMYELSTRGYFVFQPNPRGSFGQGEAFTAGNVKDLGYGDLRDILAGVDEIVKTLPVDNNRIGITGWSYGGYMTMWAVTQTNRFHAAVAGAGLANFQSYYAQNDIDEWMIPYFGSSVYDDPAIYAKSSPITFIKNARTPTLVVVGERDGECPAPQSREFWHALKTLGVPTQLVIYAGEGHAISGADHQRDIMERMVEWFDRYLKEPSGQLPVLSSQ